VRCAGVESGKTLVGAVACLSRPGPSKVPEVYRSPIIQYGGVLLAPDLQPNPERTASNLRRLSDALMPFLLGHFWQVVVTTSPELTDVRPFLWRGFEVRPRYTYRIDLADPDRVHAGFSKSLRYEIRKAEKKGVEAFASDDVDAFARLHDHTMGRKGLTPDYTADDLRRLAKELGDRAQVYLAREEGEVSCGTLVFRDERRAYYAYAAADEARFGSGAPSLLQWFVMRDLSGKGVREYDLAGANTPPIVAFKEKFGGELCMYFDLTAWNRSLLPATRRMRMFFGRVFRRLRRP
jgi:lipid II:glycine glycyltransferase (peptidoglycan interpeptide bridge formation enzyme)